MPELYAEALLANMLAQVAVMRPDPQTGAMRDIVASLMRLDDVNQLIGEMMSGLSTPAGGKASKLVAGSTQKGRFASFDADPS